MRLRAVRVDMLLAMMTLTVLSVGITGLLIDREVAAELTRPGPVPNARLVGCILRAATEAGLVSGALALVLELSISMRFARPLRRLNDLAAAIAATGPRTPRVGKRGRGIGELSATLERLGATLRRQEELRRATAADVTHELRGALGAVIGRVEAAQDGMIDADAALPHIADDARRMGRILDDVQLLVEAQRPAALMTREPVDLAAVVRRRTDAYAERFRAASIALEQKLEPARVDGDPDRLKQVVDNLLVNALRYTDAGGRVTVSVTVAEHEAVIDVTDSGIGISREHLTRIFDRFWRAPVARERAVEGLGVGLALVRDLVLAHQGRVEVESRLGSGSQFRVHLPVGSHPRADEPIPRLAGL
jgi:two-component system sensor histidine kinase BaeS